MGPKYKNDPALKESRINHGPESGPYLEAQMEVFERSSSRSTGQLAVLTSWMLISPRNSAARQLSLQVSEVPVGSEQPLHSHGPEQCYYIIRGKGLMTIEEETRAVSAGSTVYIPPNKRHGIKNMGKEVLEYLTANSPAFDHDYEKTHWPSKPVDE
jgi:mannose-6-phosphate isomerase-like protein (cupin superfamily)